MGSKQSTVQNTCMDEISNINEDELDISKINRLQTTSIKEIYNLIKSKIWKVKNLINYIINYQQFNFVVGVWFL
jgi:hypothetical protein